MNNSHYNIAFAISCFWVRNNKNISKDAPIQQKLLVKLRFVDEDFVAYRQGS